MVAVGVQREDADPVAGGDAEPGERSGGAPDPLDDLAGGARAVPEDGQRPVGTDLRRLPERLSYLHGLLLSEFDLVCDSLHFCARPPSRDCCMLVTSEHAVGRFGMSHIKPRVAGVGMVPFAKPGKSEPYDVMAKAPHAPRSPTPASTSTQVQQAYAGYVYGDSTCGQRRSTASASPASRCSTSTTTARPARRRCCWRARRSRAARPSACSRRLRADGAGARSAQVGTTGPTRSGRSST